ncbi:helix-turn-helix domain-containing protein [Thalassotalea sp. SU-HH00458]|uniref:GlxA family transcriptional regulator n=1 Tax=Thalassotalea sp. SU-HH00458 TaxID=3127657 RepID=UPI00310B0F2F
MKRPKINIALILYDGMLATSVSLPVEMLRAGEAIGRQANKKAPRLSIQMVAENEQPVVTRALIKLLPDSSVQKARKPDYAIIPSLWRNPRPSIQKQPQLIQWLKNIWNDGSTLIGGGTGVCFMAESGLLDHHPATTHWHYVEQFKRDYPKVLLKPDFFITQSDRIYCAASLNALADIIVHIIFQIYGKTAAQHVERNFSHEIRKPYEEQRYLEGAVDKHSDELIIQIQFWMQTNLNSSLSLKDVAEQFGISQRTFTRRFKNAIGISAINYWQQLKVEAAKELLASSNLSIQEISYQVGYQDQSHFTKLFKKSLSTTPKDYRLMVKKKLFSQ